MTVGHMNARPQALLMFVPDRVPVTELVSELPLPELPVDSTSAFVLLTRLPTPCTML